MRAVRSLYEGARVVVHVEDELSKFFDLNVGLEQWCVMSPWLFNIQYTVLYTVYGWSPKRNTRKSSRCLCTLDKGREGMDIVCVAVC